MHTLVLTSACTRTRAQAVLTHRTTCTHCAHTCAHQHNTCRHICEHPCTQHTSTCTHTCAHLVLTHTHEHFCMSSHPWVQAHTAAHHAHKAHIAGQTRASAMHWCTPPRAKPPPYNPLPCANSPPSCSPPPQPCTHLDVPRCHFEGQLQQAAHSRAHGAG